MGNGKKFRAMIGAVKDRASLIRATLLSSRIASSSRMAIIRATSHDPNSAPPEHYITAVISIGRASVDAVSSALMDRLHSTGDAAVALKCLVVVSRMLNSQPSVLRDPLSLYHVSGGRNFLKLSTFRDDSSPESWELSGWVRWYAVILEQNLSVLKNLDTEKEAQISALLKDVASLGKYIEHISDVPKSVHLRTNDLVHAVIRLVGEDCRHAQKELGIRIKQLHERADGMESPELSEFISVLTSLEEYRGRLQLLFANRKKNDAFWVMAREARVRAQGVKEAKQMMIGVVTKRYGELTRYAGGIAGRREQLYRLSGEGGLLDVDRIGRTATAARER